MKKIILLSLNLLFTVSCVYSQQPFTISLNPVSINGAPAIHSFAFAQLDQKWLFIGGRTNGLHGFEPPFAFPLSGVNNNIWVVDPNSNQTWSALTSNLNEEIREAITSSNMQYYQNDTMLYMVGGYGWKNSLNDYVTFATLTAIDVNGLINAVVNGTPIDPYFRQLVDSNLAITGAHLQKLDNTYYLVFGHRFDGRYDRIESNGFFVQRYSNQIRKFNIIDNGTNLAVINYSAITDTANFHRRDYNLVKQVFPDGQMGMTAFSGVFQYGINRPFYNSVNITSSNDTVINNFNQNLSQYHSAFMPVYDSLYKAMHTIFFGGISEYFYDNSSGLLTQDTLVPFVRTISQITRDSLGNMTEYNLPIQLPGLLGTNAKFILLPSIASLDNEIIKLNLLSTGPTLVGYIIGGIISPYQNISDTDPSQSTSSNYIFEVYIDRSSLTFAPQLIKEPVSITAYPNPFQKKINFDISTVSKQKVSLSIYDQYGFVIENIFNKNISGERTKISWNANKYAPGLYYYQVSAGNYSKFYRMVIVK